MKKHKAGVLAVALALGLSASPAMAAIDLYDWAFNVEGTAIESGASYPGAPSTAILGMDDSLFDWDSGIGILTWTTSTAGDHTFLSFFDHEIDEATTTFFNEYVTVTNTAAAGQSWEVDEPGYVSGDIYDNLLDGALDGSNEVPGSDVDDVSWAMGWDFNLADGETAVITLNLLYAEPTSGFYLTMYDDLSSDVLYFSSSLDIRTGEPVPEPATMLLMGTGLAGLLGIGRKKMKKA